MRSASAKALRIGVFGGTFDPPHVGHLVTAINVGHVLALDRVFLMVNNVPWQKMGIRPITAAIDRFAMVEAAVAGVPRLVAGDHEIKAGGDSYSADTLATLTVDFPGAELFLILGDDAAAGIHSWDRADEVLERARPVVVERPGQSSALDESIDWVRVEVPRLEVSSTDLRARFADGRPLDYLVTDEVLAVVRARGLYSESE